VPRSRAQSVSPVRWHHPLVMRRLTIQPTWCVTRLLR
jgi:hypothetical protein